MTGFELYLQRKGLTKIDRTLNNTSDFIAQSSALKEFKKVYGEDATRIASTYIIKQTVETLEKMQSAQAIFDNLPKYLRKEIGQL